MIYPLPCSGSTTFSSCSAGDFESLILRGGGLCLRNQPSPSDVISIPECGNGLVEQGEQCDCGKPQVKYCISDKLDPRSYRMFCYVFVCMKCYNGLSHISFLTEIKSVNLSRIT